MGQVNLFQSRNRDADVQNGHVEGEAGEGEGSVNWENR